MKTVVNFLKKNFALVWLMGSGLYYLLGEKDMSFTFLTLYIIEDVFDRIEMGMKSSKETKGLN